jgi:hypothetical protein
MCASLVRVQTSPSHKIQNFNNDEAAIKRAEDFFNSQSIDIRSVCETNLGKSLWKNMSCCSRFCAYLRCKSYEAIGHNYLKTHRVAFLALAIAINDNRNYHTTHLDQPDNKLHDPQNRNEKTEQNSPSPNGENTHRHATQITDNCVITLDDTHVGNKEKEESKSDYRRVLPPPPPASRYVSHLKPEDIGEKDSNKEEKSKELPEIIISNITPLDESDPSIELDEKPKQ